MENFHQLEANNLLHELSVYLTGNSFVNFILESVPYFIIFLILLFTLYFLRKLIALKMNLDEKQILLEITPPFLTEKEAYTTEQLYLIVHAFGKQRTLKDKLIGKKVHVSLEIVSTRNEGIRYLISTAPDTAETLKKTLISYLPQISIKQVNDYLPQSYNQLKNKKYKIVEFKLTRHFAYPLKKQDFLGIHDPISYIAGMMTKLNPSELISLQVIITPVKIKETKKILKYILKNGDILHYLNLTKLQRILSKPPNHTTEIQSSSEKNIINLIEDKIKQPLFEASITLLLISEDKNTLSERLNSISTTFASFSSSDLQSLLDTIPLLW